MSSSIQNLDHLKIPLEDILEATNHFSEENFIRQGGFGKIYKGQLLWSGELIDIVARRLDGKYGQGSKEFWTEVSMLSSLKHKNLVSIVGFCDEKNEKIVINKYEAKGSLDNYLSDPSLTWLQRLKICVGVAHALSYIHYDAERDFSVIHRNIKSSKILLDFYYQPKLAGFELSMTNISSRRHRLFLTDTCGTIGYVDPVYVKTSGVTHKSDMYSFGVVLFEVLFGRKAIINKRDIKLAQLARSHYEERRLDDMIDPDLRKQMYELSLNIFAETAYYCLKEKRAERPNIDQAISRLEKAFELQSKHENSAVRSIAANTSDHWKETNLEYLMIDLRDIRIATNNFDAEYKIGSGDFTEVFKAKLDVCDIKNISEIEGKSELPKRSATVAIKRYHNNTDIHENFIAEIETMSSCKHRNVISLLGFCDEHPEKITVYEHASNGTLADYLESDSRFMKKFTWVQRIKLCIEIAHGLNYVHTSHKDKQKIIHRNIKSENILLKENWEAIIDDFGLSVFQQEDFLYIDTIAGTEMYLDPEYLKTGRLSKEVDIYSFGVVLFEVYCGRLAYDRIFYKEENEKWLAPMARRCFKEGALHEMIDPYLKEDANENISMKALNQDSLETFLQIAYQCVQETHDERPTMEVVIKELEKALYFQENNKDNFLISLDEIKLATRNFSHPIGKGGFGQVYRGEVTHAIGRKIIAAKRLDRKSGQGETQLMTELEILLEYKHANVIGLVGYCDEKGEKIIVYEYATRGSLDRWLKHNDLTWRRRLAICVDIASGLDFLHGTSDVKQEVVIHRDIKAANILLHDDWKAKIADFGLSLISPINQEMNYVIDNAKGTSGYCDPLYITTSMLTKESDIYSFGVLLFEMLCGRFVMEYNNSNARNLVHEVRRHYEEGRLNEMVFEAIKKQMVQESLTAFQEIAYQCIHKEREDRPTAKEVLIQLKKALQFQDDRDIWEPKLPKDYQQLIQMSNSEKYYSDMSKMDFYNELFEGILLQKGRLWLSLGTNKERNEMISATKFTYKNRRPHKWGSIPKSRFQKVAEMLDITNLNIRIKIRTQFLSPGVNYGVYLVFKFGGPSKTSSRPMYVNLTYKMENETLHSYIATWRDETWMMIEMSRFLNHKEEAKFEVLLESFSRCYCGTGAIYVEGVEFRAIDNVKLENVKKLKGAQQVLKPRSNIYEVKQLPSEEGEKVLSAIGNVKGTKHHMISAKEAIIDSSNVKHFNSKPSAAESRFEEVIQVLRQQVLHIKCKIESQMLSPDAEYACYLVFKLSEKCCGLHCPVIVRDLLDWKNKRSELIYFRSPSALNRHDIDQVSEKREDGTMEVILWKFNSNSKSRNGYVPVNLKLISYEGTMSGLIVYGLEFRPM